MLTVRCEAAKGAEPEAEHTLMAGVAKQEAAERAEGDVPSLHEKLERKEKLEGEATVGAAYATTAGLTGQLLSMAERLGDQSQKAGTLTRSFEVSFDTDRVKQAVSQVPLFNSEGGPDSDPDEGFSMLASEEEDNAKHNVHGGGERRKEAQCGQHTQPQQEGDTEKEPEEVHVHVECKHGFALVSGTRDRHPTACLLRREVQGRWREMAEE